MNGIYVAMSTPMNGDESLNIAELHRQVDRFQNAGVDALFCLGTNGEFFALEMDERLTVMNEVINNHPGRTVPVCVGVGCVTTRDTIRLAQEAEAAGADAVSVITPYFVSLTQEQIEIHYRAVADSVSLPVILYNIPARTQNAIHVDTVARLAEVDNIVAIKDSSGNIENVRAFIDSTPEGFGVFTGTDSLILQGLKMGSWGAVSGLANICPRLVVRIYRAWKEGREEEARSAQTRLSEVRKICTMGNPNTITKLATNIVGQPVGPARAPASGASREVETEVREHLAATLDPRSDV